MPSHRSQPACAVDPNTQPPPRSADISAMPLGHEKLATYHRTLDLLDLVGQIYDAMRPGRAHLKDQLDRAATSIVLNTAEGAGEFSPDEKVRFSGSHAAPPRRPLRSSTSSSV